jgi:tRNA pseudouridine38-40 synthase
MRPAKYSNPYAWIALRAVRTRYLSCYRPKVSRICHWKLTVAYDGTRFHGWQVQPGLPTIQGTLADALLKITGESILPQGSGRTDTGVHALGQVASVSLTTPIPPSNLQRALNNLLPGSIRILRLEAASPDFHARHSARRKTYEYRICPEPVCPPTLAAFVWNCSWPLELAAMQRASAYVVGDHDFTSFAATDPDLAIRSADEDESLAEESVNIPRGAVRTIFASAWKESTMPDGVRLLCYRVTGSGFLHHMVRNLVGTFVDVGRGRTSDAAMPAILEARSRSAAGPTAPPQGLFLVNVEYDE